MEIEIIGTGARMSLSDWFSAHRGICFALPLTNEALAAAHEAFPDQVPLARIMPPEPPELQPEPVLQTITRAQGKAALIHADLWEPVLAYVAEIEDSKGRALAEVALHDTLEWRRTSPFLNAAASALGLTPDQLDALFIQASAVEL